MVNVLANKIKILWQKNKYSIILLLFVFIVFTYCSLQAFPINDDLPYSFFYRGSTRVTTIKQIILNQMSDYLTINGRFFIHCVVQFMLMFNRNLFSFINSLCLVVTFTYLKKIITFYLLKNQIERKISNTFFLLMIIGLFLLIGNLKYMVYWVAGSVNYIWVFTGLVIFLYYYLKYGLLKYKVLNCILFLSFSIIHECSFVFMLFIIIGDFVKNIVERKKRKHINVYILYLLLAIIGGLFVIKSPGNAARMAVSQGWYNMSIIERFSISLPVIAKSIFNVFDLNNLLPTVFLISLNIYVFIRGCKLLKVLNILSIIVSIVSFITGNGWIYFILSILIFILLIIHNYNEKNNNMSVLLISFYAVVFSMAITPEFKGGRPNYYLFLFMIIYICIFINVILKRLKFVNLIKLIIIVFCFVMIGYEYKIYSYIGNVQKVRLKQIDKVKKDKLNVLEYKKIDEKYAKYHADANGAGEKDYWAYRYFVTYYDLPDDIEIKLVD